MIERGIEDWGAMTPLYFSNGRGVSKSEGRLRKATAERKIQEADMQAIGVSIGKLLKMA